MHFLLLSLLACTTVNDTPPEYPAVVPGPPQAGAAEGYLELPIGTPLGCYTARCKCLGSFSYQDRRQGPYNVGFDESTGIHTRPTIKAIWIENDNQDLVMLKWDSCMSNDELLDEITKGLEAATGKYLEGKVTLTANHTHSGYGGYNDQWHWYLGTDRQNEEIFRRMVDQFVQVGVDAWNARQEAKLGVGWADDWDPNNRVYSDRRGDNNDLVVWPDQEGWETGKDPHAAILRVDSLQDEPIAMAVVFGIHGIIMDADNPMVSGDSAGGLEHVLQEQFEDGVVVMHLQGAGGDASPRGVDRDWARMESIGEFAQGPLMELYDAVPTSADPITLEVASRHIWEHRDQIRVTRGGTVDWYYGEYQDPNTFHADNAIFDDNGEILSPIDEFNSQYGAVFCGEDVPLIPGGGLESVTETFPYTGCVLLESISPIVSATFGYTLDDIDLPFKEDYKAGTTATLLGPLPTLTDDGEIVNRPLMVGFFPGEPVALYSEQWRRRVEAELGYEHALLVGYSQDHEGYLMIPEDWFRGGYEPSISVWGPLQGEHIMEGVLEYSGEFLGNDVHEDPDPTGYYARPQYNDYDLPTEHPVNTDNDQPVPLFPDHTPDAGTRVFEAIDTFWVPKDMRQDLDGDGEDDPPDLSAFPETVDRVGGLLQFGWIGGDPMVDPPHVTLEREVDGSWEPVRTHSGRVVTEAMGDILVGYTPDPFFPHSAQQTHYYWAAWQAVGTVHDRMGLPLGNYRFRVDGQHYVGNSETWPWDSEPYELLTESFELVPATLQLEAASDGLWVWVDSPALGFRLVDLEGNSRGRNPARGALSVDVDGTVVEVPVDHVDGGRAKVLVDLTDAVSVTVTDPYGNTGSLAL